MTTTHDDYPHPVPPLAHLRWKENWLFVVMAPQQSVYGVVDVNTEPTYDRARFTCNLNVQGTVYKYGAETKFPREGSRELKDSAMSVQLIQPHQLFEVEIESGEVVCAFAVRRPLIRPSIWPPAGLPRQKIPVSES